MPKRARPGPERDETGKDLQVQINARIRAANRNYLIAHHLTPSGVLDRAINALRAAEKEPSDQEAAAQWAKEHRGRLPILPPAPPSVLP